MKEFEKKYFGILKNFDFDNININSINELIEKRIFDEFDLSNCYLNDEDYFIADSATWEFGDFFIQNRKEYHLKKEVYIEMISLKELHFIFENFERFTKEIEVLVYAEFILENKLKVLNENYKKYFNQIRNKQYYPLFKNQILTDGYESWEQYFIDDIVGNENYASVVKFLTGNNKFINTEIENQWNDYYLFSQISDYLEKKRNEILNIKIEFSDLIKNNIFNEIIFKENAEDLFSYIVTKYPKTKNTAFFSYLYFFMKDNLKLLYTIGNDSKDYRMYINKLFKLNFSRIQNTSSENQYKKNDMFKLFEIYVKEYYSLKNETNLSKNE